MATITLTLEVTEQERAALVQRFIQTAVAVSEAADTDDGGIPSDPNGSKVDATGVVWDARYHGANMTKNQDGTWRRKKGMSEQDKADADQYEAGCRGQLTATTQAAAGVPVTAAPAAAPVPTPTAPPPDVPAFLQTGAFPVPGMPPLAAPVPVAPAPVDYPTLIAAFQAAAGRVGEPRLQAEIAGIYERSGVTVERGGMTLLETDPNIRIAVKAELDKLV